MFAILRHIYGGAPLARIETMRRSLAGHADRSIASWLAGLGALAASCSAGAATIVDWHTGHPGNHNPGSPVQAIVQFDDGSGPRTCVGGGFRSAGALEAAGVACWNGSAWTPLGARSTAGEAFALLVADGALWAGRSGGVERWNGSTWVLAGPSQASLVNALASYRGQVHAIGNFGEFQAHEPGIARWTGSRWETIGRLPINVVAELLVVDDALVVGGSFTTIDDRPVPGLARWDGTQWTPWPSGCDGAIHALIDRPEGLLVGGDFQACGGQPTGPVARWDGSRWHALGAGLPGPVRALAIHDHRVIAAGVHVDADLPEAWVAEWNEGRWSSLAERTPGIVLAMAPGPAGLEIARGFEASTDIPEQRRPSRGRSLAALRWRHRGPGRHTAVAPGRAVRRRSLRRAWRRAHPASRPLGRGALDGGRIDLRRRRRGAGRVRRSPARRRIVHRGRIADLAARGATRRGLAASGGGHGVARAWPGFLAQRTGRTGVASLCIRFVVPPRPLGWRTVDQHRPGPGDRIDSADRRGRISGLHHRGTKAGRAALPPGRRVERQRPGGGG